MAGSLLSRPVRPAVDPSRANAIPMSQIAEALEAAGVPALAVVDHHEYQERLRPAFADIRRIGATATIYAEYLERRAFSAPWAIASPPKTIRLPASAIYALPTAIRFPKPPISCSPKRISTPPLSMAL